MTPGADRYALVITPTARRQLAEHLPEAVAFAAHEFIVGALLDNPQRVGQRHRPDHHSARRGTYRVIYRIDEKQRTVTVVDIAQPVANPVIRCSRKPIAERDDRSRRGARVRQPGGVDGAVDLASVLSTPSLSGSRPVTAHGRGAERSSRAGQHGRHRERPHH